jgi:hypothetical protein
MTDRGTTRTSTGMYFGVVPFTTNPIRLKAGIYPYLRFEKSVPNEVIVTFLRK